jgi:hypothetical protein
MVLTKFNKLYSNYVSIKDIQKCVNWFAAGVHAADPSALVTNGA